MKFNLFFRRTCFVLSVSLCTFNVHAQNSDPVFYRSFDESQNEEIQRALTDVTTSRYQQKVFISARSKGIKGQAMDLTDDIPLRIPEILAKDVGLQYGADNSFTIQLWVSTKKGAQQGTPVMSNKKMDDPQKPGWMLGTKESGAWYWQVSDGKRQYLYEPTAQRQSINDGKWHQLTVVVDRHRQEMWMYLDGRNVAIYNIEGLKSLESEFRTVIGGSDENNEEGSGSRGEWTAFNGKIDEVKIWNRVVSSKEIAESYQNMMPVTKSTDHHQPAINGLKVQTWNIWHGGHRYGQHVGVARVIDVLKRENADVIGLIETYGSGAIIADSLDYYFYLISTNLSIMSRYPIEECIHVFKPFNSGGAVIHVSSEQKLVFFDIWLHWKPNICDLQEDKTVLEKLLEDEKKSRLMEINDILHHIQHHIANSESIPVVMAGDFNCGSHLDWTNEYKALHQGMVVEWPVSLAMQKAGFHDSFRQMNPDVFKTPGFTWSPYINQFNQSCIPDRIDFIYYQGNKLIPYRSETLDHYPLFWPSDHASVTTNFYWVSSK